MSAAVTVSFPPSRFAVDVSARVYAASPAPSSISKSVVISIAVPSYVTDLSLAVIEGIFFPESATRVLPACSLVTFSYSSTVPSSFFIYILNGRYSSTASLNSVGSLMVSRLVQPSNICSSSVSVSPCGFKLSKIIPLKSISFKLLQFPNISVISVTVFRFNSPKSTEERLEQL